MVPPDRRFLLAHFEATLYFRRITNLLADINATISYYVHVNSLWLKSSVYMYNVYIYYIASKWASKHLWGWVPFILLLMIHIYLQIQISVLIINEGIIYNRLTTDRFNSRIFNCK